MSVLGDDAPKHDYLYFSCKDIRNACRDDEQGKTAAYTWSKEGLLWSNHFVVFCEDYFQLYSMSELIAKYQDQPHEQKVMENFEISRGGTMYHELFHKSMVGKPHIGDKYYGAFNCYYFTYAQGTEMASTNADSYQLDAIAIHVQQKYTRWFHYSLHMAHIDRTQFDEPSAMRCIKGIGSCRVRSN